MKYSKLLKRIQIKTFRNCKSVHEKDKNIKEEKKRVNLVPGFCNIIYLLAGFFNIMIN